MKLEKRLYQLVISRLDGDRIHQASYSRELQELVIKGIGGFIVFGGSRTEIGDFIRGLQNMADLPLFIASDVERGVGQQVKGATSLPCAMAVAAALDSRNPEDEALIEKMVKGLADEAVDNGINMPLIPVMDVNQDPDNPIICTRAFSDDLQKVSWFGSKYIMGIERAGLISCAKHFPGHGDTDIDSHIALPVIKKKKEDLAAVDLLPFVSAIASGVSSIMVGHLAMPALDDMPATLSKKIMCGLLREELGFRGLILTDALDMHSLDNIVDLPVKCVNAGADMLLHPADADAAVSILRSAVASSGLDENILNSAVDRIVKEKERLGRLMPREADYGGNLRLSASITDRSITILKNTPGLLPLAGEKSFRLIIAGDAAQSLASPLSRRASGTLHVEDLNNLPLPAGKGDETFVFAIFTAVAAWKGSSGIAVSVRERIEELVKQAKKSIVISFGSPYVLRYFDKADILIAAYEPTYQAQDSVIKCLNGEMDFMGRPPVKLIGLG